ncbi:MAG: hypothetical protein C4320_05585 [Armatimonadota bacterium]
MIPSNKRAFTLIELLVVIAIIAILAAILFPVFAQAKAAAKRTQNLSNFKNVDTAMILYTGDADDLLPATRVVENGGDWWTPRMRIWKDVVLPYIKNGGTKDKATGVFNDKAGNGGVFQDPLNAAAWSTEDQIGPNRPGDETARFPRSIAVNKDAGRNEFGGPRGGRCADTIWPEVYPNGSGGQDVYNQGGNQGSLINPAGTIMLAPTRKIFPDTESSEMGKAGTATGKETGVYPSGFSLVTSGGNQQITVGFFDGHAKSVSAYQSLANDLWGAYGPGGIPACGWTMYTGPGNGQPFKEGIITNMRQIKEWNN